MTESDDLTFARFAARFARIEHLIPEPRPARSIPAINSGSLRLSLTGAAGLIGAVLVLVLAAGLAIIGAPGPSPSPSGVLSADAATAIAISQVASTTPVRVLSVRLSVYGTENVGSAVDADTPVWAIVLAGTFAPPSCGPYTATPHPCPPAATTALVLIDARSGAFIESMMPAPSASPTTSPTTAPDVTAWYPDGVPMTIDGEKVYRPEEVVPELHSAGPILVGGWDFGPLAVSCPFQLVGASNPPCPIYEGLSEVRGGPNILSVRWDAPFQNTAPAVVVRAELVPMDGCTSDPPGGCPTHPTLHALGYVWQGEPGPPTSATASSVPGVAASCTPTQLVVDPATFGYGFGALGTTLVFVTEPLRNVGGDCVLTLPTEVEAVSATVPFRTVSVVDTGTADGSGGYLPTMSVRIPSGGSVSIVIGAWWWTGAQPAGGTPLPSPPCSGPISDVTAVELPMAAGTVVFELPIVLKQVCSSPASISLTIGNG